MNALSKTRNIKVVKEVKKKKILSKIRTKRITKK